MKDNISRNNYEKAVPEKRSSATKRQHSQGGLKSRRVCIVSVIACVLVIIIGPAWWMLSSGNDTQLGPESSHPSMTGLIEARQKVSFPVFIPTEVPEGLTAENPTVDEKTPAAVRVRISYRTETGSIGLDVLNSPAGTGLDADPRKTGETIQMRDGIAGHFIDNQPHFGEPILWWNEAGAYVPLAGPYLTKTDLVKIAESMSSTADIDSQGDEQGGNTD